MSYIILIKAPSIAKLLVTFLQSFVHIAFLLNLFLITFI